MAESLLFAAALCAVSLLAARLLPVSLQLHPVSLVARFCQKLALKVNPDARRPAAQQRVAGFLALLLVLSLPLLLWYGFYLMSSWPLLLDAIILLCCFSWAGYRQLGLSLCRQLEQGQLAQARQQAQRLLLRDTKALSQLGLVKAALESLAVRFQQQVVAIIFWYLIAGAAGALCCRLCQIASQQWSVKRPEFREFGRAAALCSRLFNVPAYLLGAMLLRLQSVGRQAQAPVERAEGKAFPVSRRLLLQQLSRTLKVSLGGPARYQQHEVRRPRLQQRYEPVVADVRRLLTLLDYQLYIWLLLLCLCCCLLWFVAVPG